MEHALINFSLIDVTVIVPKAIVGYSVKWLEGAFVSMFATVVD
jgi:hypothetical protein